MSITSDRRWLHEIAVATRELVLGSFESPSACIASTRIAVAVLEHFQVNAKPLPVRVLVENEPSAVLRANSVPFERWPEEAWSVAIDGVRPNDTGSWNGHLVMLVRSDDRFDFGAKRVLVDVSADQFDRPAKRIRLQGPVIIGLRAGQGFTPQDPLCQVFGTQGLDLTAVAYWPMSPGSAKAQEWRQVSEWNLSETSLAEAVDLVAARVGDPHR